MSLLSSLVGFGLRQVIGVDADGVIAAVEKRFTDHSRTLPQALERAHERSWDALSVALAGDGFLDSVKVFFSSGDDKGVREQITLFLQSNARAFEGSPANFRQVCLTELKRLRKSGLLSTQDFTVEKIAHQTANFKRQTDPQGLIEEASRAVAQVADALPPDYPNLRKLLRTPTPGGPPLLAAAFAYFFRREVETDDELAHGLFFDGLRQLSASQARGFGDVNKALITLGDRFDELFEQMGRIEAIAVQTQGVASATHGAVLDIQGELQRLNGLHLTNAAEVRSLLVQVQQQLGQIGMQRGEVRPQHSFSIQGEDERRAVKSLLVRLRQLPVVEKRQVPALLNGVGKLQIGAGDFGGAKETFAEVAALVGDPAAKAEAFFNEYRAALEEKKWDAAVQAIRQAAALDAPRFAPFPLHRYEPKRILGAGGFGTAFLCHDRNFDEEVVIKTLHAADLERGMDDVFREARTLHRLSHPAIIRVRDCEFADAINKAHPFLVMDYFHGGTLEQFVEQRGTLTPEQLLPVAVQIALGMQAAHSQGVFHRDLKPANVLVRKEGVRWQVKIIDFGLALRKSTIETSVSRAGSEGTLLSHSVAGTLQYAPPEQMGRMPGVKPGPYSDVYAFGKTCCSALFKTTEPRSRHLSGLPSELRDLLERCIEQELEHRHQNFEPVLAVLATLDSATVRPPHARTAATPPPAPALAATPPAPAPTAPPAPPTVSPRELVNSIGMKLVLIPSGRFLMGIPPCQEYEDPGTQHEVEISHSFYLGAFQVTQAEYEHVIGSNPSFFSPIGCLKKKVVGLDTRRFPVEGVSWDDAIEFCKRLSKMPEEKRFGRVYRLPTEAEWEYSCREAGRSAHRFQFGDSLCSTQANFCGKCPFPANGIQGPWPERTTAVGSYEPNVLGLYDMHGNVREWCADWYEYEYHEKCPRRDPQGPKKGDERVVRGGSWNDDGLACVSYCACHESPGSRSDEVGFRVLCVRTS